MTPDISGAGRARNVVELCWVVRDPCEPTPSKLLGGSGGALLSTGGRAPRANGDNDRAEGFDF